MYQVESTSSVLKARDRLLGRRVAVPATVIGLGWTSLLTDVSSEMVASVLPIYLMVGLQLGPMQLALIDGLQHAATAVVRLVSGWASDRSARHKEVAALGYGLSAASRLGLLAAGASTGGIAAAVLADRLGKGIRTAPRDAMISLATPARDLATAFGVHRAMDSAGAMLGPVLAFALLAAMPGAFDVVFVASFCVALVGLGVLGLLVRAPRVERRDGEPPIGARGVLALLARRRFSRLVAVGALLGAATVGDGFVYLTLQQRMQADVGLFPLMFVATALAYLLLAVPVGRLADRAGRVRAYLAGFAVLPALYALAALGPAGWGTAIACLALLGAHYAATDGVLAAIASAELPAPARASGLALLATAIGLAKLGASLLFGFAWSRLGIEGAALAFAAALPACIAAAALVLHRTASDVRSDPSA